MKKGKKKVKGEVKPPKSSKKTKNEIKPNDDGGPATGHAPPPPPHNP